MEWFQVLTILLGVFGMFLWGQRESRSEIRAIRAEMKDFQNAVKDFHGRLCSLEERRK